MSNEKMCYVFCIDTRKYDMIMDALNEWFQKAILFIAWSQYQAVMCLSDSWIDIQESLTADPWYQILCARVSLTLQP